MAEVNPLEILGLRIKQVRTDANFSQREVARLLDVSKQTVSQWEVGRSPPMIHNLIRFSAVMQVDIRDLLSGLQEEISPTNHIFRRVTAASDVVPLFADEMHAGKYILDGSGPLPDKIEFTSAAIRRGKFDMAFKLSTRANEPKFHPGDIIYLREASTFEPGQYVLAHASAQIVFRSILPISHGTFSGAKLIARNKSYPEIEMTSDDRILGVMAQFTGFSHD